MGFLKEKYTTNYYMNLVLGSEEWKRGELREKHKNILDKFDFAGKRVLDLGCGRGDVLRYLISKGATVTGVDFSEDAICLARKTAPEATLINADAKDIDYSRYDIVIMFDVIEHIPADEIDAVLASIRCPIILDTPNYSRYEDYIAQGRYIKPSPTDLNPLTVGMHCTKYTNATLTDKLMEHGYCLSQPYYYTLIDRSSVVVAFYTVDTPYEQEIDNLRQSLVRHKQYYRFFPRKNLSKWEFNCGQKPEVLLEALTMFDCPIMYVDADAVIRQDLELLHNFTGDFGCHYRDNKELLSGTLLLNPTVETMNLVEAWCEEQKLQPNEWDQRVLQRVLETYKSKIKFVELPESYVKIFDRKGEAVVEHYQASRRFKNKLFITGTSNVQYPGCRMQPDGSIVLTRKNKAVEKELSDRFIKIGHNRWLTVSAGNLDPYRGIHTGSTITIVGKGPSLDLIARLPDGPVIGLNEAFNKIQGLGHTGPVYGTQLDANLRDTCKPVSGTLFTSPRAGIFYKNALVVPPQAFKLHETPLSVEFAICLARYMGSNEVNLFAFDAATDKKIAYAKCVGYEPTNMGPAERFLSHRERIEKCALDNNIKINWFDEATIRKDYSSSAFVDTPQQSLCSPVEHHEPFDACTPDTKPNMTSQPLDKVLTVQQTLACRSQNGR